MDAPDTSEYEGHVPIFSSVVSNRGGRGFPFGPWYETAKSRVYAKDTVADLEGGRAGSPPPLGDGLTPSLTVMLANAKF